VSFVGGVDDDGQMLVVWAAYVARQSASASRSVAVSWGAGAVAGGRCLYGKMDFQIMGVPHMDRSAQRFGTGNGRRAAPVRGVK
jgi:hypothetical protein